MYRNYLTLLFLVFVCTCARAQTVNGIPIAEIETEYALIVGISKFLSTKVNIEIEFGQHNKAWNNKDTQLIGEDGKPLTLNSMVDALNFMSQYNYEFLQAYAITVGNQNVYHYLMKKKE
jgi:hypothetical protein